ncbi:hypothetical protein C8E86_3357 [Catellatospora citrea]|nr:hypothetical protein C8E86_3357 [Catellatospora citrea]
MNRGDLIRLAVLFVVCGGLGWLAGGRRRPHH